MRWIEFKRVRCTRSHPFLKRWACAAWVTLTLTACGTVPLEPPPEAAPIFRQLDARVGVVYASSARTAFLSNPLIRIEVGQASVARFERVFASMIRKKVEGRTTGRANSSESQTGENT